MLLLLVSDVGSNTPGRNIEARGEQLNPKGSGSGAQQRARTTLAHYRALHAGEQSLLRCIGATAPRTILPTIAAHAAGAFIYARIIRVAGKGHCVLVVTGVRCEPLNIEGRRAVGGDVAGELGDDRLHRCRFGRLLARVIFVPGSAACRRNAFAAAERCGGKA